MKKLVKFYEAEANKELKGIQITQNDLQKIYDEFAKVTKGKKPLTIEELKTMFSSNYGRLVADEDAIKDLIFDRYVSGKEFGGLKVRRDAVELPPIDEIVKAIKSTIKEATIYLGKGYFEIESGTVKVRDWVEKTVIEENKVYAETEEELQRLELAQRLCDALNDVQEVLPPEPFFKSKIYFLDSNLDTVVEPDEEGIFHPSDYFVKIGKAVPTGTPMVAPQAAPKEAKPESKDFDKYIETLLANN